MKNKLAFVLISLVFVGGCTSQSQKFQKDFDAVCSVYKDGLQKLADPSVNLTELSIKMAKDLDSNIKTPEIKRAVEAVGAAIPEQKYMLLQQVAEDQKVKFDCPEFKDFITKVLSLSATPESTPQESEGDANEAL